MNKSCKREWQQGLQTGNTEVLWVFFTWWPRAAFNRGGKTWMIQEHQKRVVALCSIMSYFLSFMSLDLEFILVLALWIETYLKKKKNPANLCYLCTVLFLWPGRESLTHLRFSFASISFVFCFRSSWSDKTLLMPLERLPHTMQIKSEKCVFAHACVCVCEAHPQWENQSIHQSITQLRQ